jgi:hypothetical protein
MTVQHEIIHFCLAKLNESDEMDEVQEESLIFHMAWAEEIL